MTNWRLWVGLSLTAILIIIAIIGPAIAPYDEDYVMEVEYFYNGEDDYGIISNPAPPSAKHPFGTDKWGYDILTLLLHGAKYTIFISLLVAFMRVVVGGGLGILMGNLKNSKNNNLGFGFGLLGSIPQFLILYFVLFGITINSSLSVFELTFLQTVLMVLIGVPGVFSATKSKTIELKKNLFITASRALGAGPWWVTTKQIIPHLRGSLLSLFIKEIILTLTLMGQLGIFKLFLGGTILRLHGPAVYLSKTNEWTGLIGQWRSFIYSYEWILMYPLAAFVITIFSFYLLSRGIEIYQRDQLKRYPHI
ncbi:ABC transporter permease subunit [Filobacillus milosensis]|uniref:ABC transporter permease subunit n=1 Tax=Filobacillus milosensis TaxID=94137 RepID=A0A4Y8ITK9_9BACI|nr:ABC transporter permease subunit [Filobacillus milosensis]TFB24041.1 ABC transporter permease subunit [Filobacillus milosensis]